MRNYGNPIGGPAALGGVSNDRPSRGVLLPQHSLLTPDDPPTSDDMEASTFAAIGFGIAAFCIVGGLIYLGASFTLQ